MLFWGEANICCFGERLIFVVLFCWGLFVCFVGDLFVVGFVVVLFAFHFNHNQLNGYTNIYMSPPPPPPPTSSTVLFFLFSLLFRQWGKGWGGKTYPFEVSNEYNANAF